jgi:tetratricopeptide (TPR) repeat protein
MSDSPTPTAADRYFNLIDHIVQMTLKGQLRSKEQIYQLLMQDVQTGTGEIFERCLQTRRDEAQIQLENPDELKQAKASRIMRALQAIQGEWERYQKAQSVNEAITNATQSMMVAEPQEQVTVWLNWIDPNQPHGVKFDRLKELAQALNKATVSRSESVAFSETVAFSDVHQLSLGIENGMKAVQQLEPYLIQWVYEIPSAIGFEGTPSQWGPWKLWSERSENLLPKQVFAAIANGQPIVEVLRRQGTIGISEFAELVVLFQYLQRGLITWFEKQPYDSKWGTKQSVATFLTFAVLWSQLSVGFEQASALKADDRPKLAQGCFQVMLQILRRFSQQPYFPLYGGVFALLSGNYLKDALTYLDAPLRQVPGTQEKARILTLIGYSQRAVGQYDRAIEFHQQALDIAQTAADRACEIANLNHLSRIYASQKEYEKAIHYSQRALVLARQGGDRQGEANALTNLGYGEVLLARQLDRLEPESYEMAISYLEQGLALAEKLGDRQSQSLCYNSLGIAYVLLEQPQQAIPYLEKGAQAAQFSGDMYLQGLNYSYLAEAHYTLGNQDAAICAANLGMYVLEQIQATEWRQPAGLLSILQGQMGDAAFQQAKANGRSTIIAIIGVDGYDHLAQLLTQYKGTLP